MLTALIGDIVIGALLGLRFNVVILIPASFLALFVTATTGIARGDGLWSTAATMAVALAALQVGYVVGGALPIVAGVKASAHRASTSIPSGVSRPT